MLLPFLTDAVIGRYNNNNNNKNSNSNDDDGGGGINAGDVAAVVINFVVVSHNSFLR